MSTARSPQRRDISPEAGDLRAPLVDTIHSIDVALPDADSLPEAVRQKLQQARAASAALLARLDGKTQESDSQQTGSEEFSGERLEQRYRALAKAAGQAVWFYRPSPLGRSEAPDQEPQPAQVWWEKVTGQTFADQQRDGWLERVHPEDAPRAASAWEMAVRDGEEYDVEYRVLRQDGRVVYVHARGVPVHNPDGSVDEWVGALRDITESKRAEEALHRSERLYRAIGETNDYGIWVCDPEGRNIYISESFLKLVGMTQEQCSVEGWSTALHPEDAASTMAAWRACVQLGGVWDREHRVLGTDGKYHPVLARGVPVRDDTGQVLYWAGINLDISRLKKAEEQLRESERRLQAVIDNAAAMIYVKDRRGRFVLINRRFEDVFQITRNEVFGKTDHQIFPPKIAEAFTENDGKVLEAGQPIEVEEVAPHADGLRDYLSIKFPLRHADGEIYAICGISTDITARKQTEAALHESEQRFRRTVETANEGIWLVDAEGKTTFANQRMCELLGCEPEQVQGQRIQDFVFEEDLPAIEQHIALNVQGQTEQFDFRFRRGNGSEVLVLGCTSPVEGADGTIVGALGMFSDITDRRRSEDALKEADRRKDEFLAMLAHELRNPLAAISSAHQLTTMDGLEAQEQAWAGEVIGRQLGQLTAIIDDLLDVSRITRGKIQLKNERLRLDEIVARAVASLRPLVEQHRHTLAVQLPATPVWVDGDSNRIEQVVVNLINNACKYTTEQGRIEVDVKSHAGTATVAVRDSGLGIAPEMLPKIFDLFAQADHSLDRSKGGLGIGLTLVRSLVELHGGQIAAFSDGLGHGSMFVVELPLAGVEQDSPAVAAVVSPTCESSACRILVVDDNLDAARGLALLLRADGHEVTLAHDGPAAYELAQIRRPQVILLDIGLPKMDGYEVARRIRQTASLDKILLVAISGYGQSDDLRRSLEAGFDQHLVKPVKYAELLGILRRVSPPTSNVRGASAASE